MNTSKPRRLYSALRIAWIIASGILLVWSSLPLINYIYNAGVLISIPVAAVSLAVGIGWPSVRKALQKLWKRKVGRMLIAVVSGVLFVLLALFVTASCIMLHAAAKKPEEQATVIVLGAAVYGDRPSRMLAARLNTAAKYLEANPDSACIVSGGQGNDEEYAEAQVMYDYLVEKGVDPSRIYQEDRSTNTEENIRYSREIIAQNGLNPHVVIATQEFHQYRAQTLAKKQGLNEVGPATCRTPWHLLECYWVREFAAVCRLWILGH